MQNYLQEFNIFLKTSSFRGESPKCGEKMDFSKTHLFDAEKIRSESMDLLKENNDYNNVLKQEMRNRAQNRSIKMDTTTQRVNIAYVQLHLKTQGRDREKQTANMLVNEVDKVFHPQKLNPDDTKVIFYLVDYVVFNGMKDSNVDGLKNILLLDSEKRTIDSKQIQNSIAKEELIDI